MTTPGAVAQTNNNPINGTYFVGLTGFTDIGKSTGQQPPQCSDEMSEILARFELLDSKEYFESKGFVTLLKLMEMAPAVEQQVASELILANRSLFEKMMGVLRKEYSVKTTPTGMFAEKSRNPAVQ